jgi:hypothetical protein
VGDRSDTLSDDSTARKRRDRWRRNKRDERARKAHASPQALDAGIIERIWAERDRRLTSFPTYCFDHPNWHSMQAALELHCDVWAVREILKAGGGHKRVTAGKVANLMHSSGLGRDYTPASLRTVVYRAFDLIEKLESMQRRDGSGPIWPPFCASNGADG